MKRPSHSETPATQMLRAHQVVYEEFFYTYVEQGGTAVSSAALGVPEHAVVKTLVMQDEAARPLIVLMHGDRMVSTRNLARQIQRKRISPCAPDVAQRHSGYQVGGTSPFGLRKSMPLCMERSILQLPRLWINGGRRGFLVALDPNALVRVLQPTLVDVALETSSIAQQHPVVGGSGT